jgi:gliding motility-associated-like protein
LYKCCRYSFCCCKSKTNCRAIISNSVVCSGTNVNLTGSGGGTYAWSGPGAFTSALSGVVLSNVNNSAGGTYSLIVTNGFSCSDTAYVSLAVNQTPTVTSVSSGTVICEGQSFQLNVVATPTTALYNWSGPNSYTSASQNNTIPSSTVNQSGTYSVTANLGLCASTISTISITVNPNPVAIAAISNTVTCSGNNINLSGNGGGTYAWSGPGSFSSPSQNVVLTNVNTTASGTYTLVVTNAFSCSDDTTVSLTVNPTPTVTSVSTGTVVCAGQSFQLNVVATPTNSSYSWSGPNSYTSTSQNNTIPNAVVGQSGTYSVTANVGACFNTASTVSVVVNPNPVAIATNTATAVICSGSNVNLTGLGGGTYSWSGPGSYTSAVQNPIISNSSTAGTGTYTLVVTDPNGCINSDTANVTINQTPLPAVTIGASTCIGDPLVLNASGSGTINWYSDAALTNLVLANSSTYTPTVSGTSTYYVSVTSSGCTSTGASVTANNFNVHATATASPNSGYAPLQVNFASVVTGATNPAYQWTFGNSNTSTNANPANTFNNGGTYTVTLMVTDVPSNCKDSVKLFIKVDDDVIVIIPNIFTPNSDSINDIFSTTIRGAKSATGIIFNRWGQLIYSWDSMNANWDGKMTNGNDATDGTYFYLIKVISLKGEEKEFNGPLTLVR